MAVAIRNIDWRKVNRVAIAFVLMVSFLCLVCWTAPQAHAITMTVTVGIVLLCIAMLAAFGMTVTAPDNTSAINYLMPKILTFAQSKGYDSIEDWVAGETGRRPTLVTLFSVIGSALVVESPIWNCLLEYTKSFVLDEGITSGGSAVGDLGENIPISVENPYGQYASYTGSFVAQVISNDTLTVTLNQWRSLTWYNGTVYSEQYGIVNIPINSGIFDITVSWVNGSNGNTNPANYSIQFLFSNDPSSHDGIDPNKTTITGSSYNATYRINNSSGYKYLKYRLPMSHRGTSPYPVYDGIATFKLTNVDYITDPGTVFTPGDTIIEPDPLDLGENGLVYVPGLVDSMSNEDALNHVADKTATPGGLTAEPDKDGYPIPAGSEWLFDKLTDIDNGITNQNPHTDWIPNSPFNFSFSGIWHYVEDWLDSFTSGIAAVLAVWNEIPLLSGALYGALVAAVVVGVWRRFFE